MEKCVYYRLRYIELVKRKKKLEKTDKKTDGQNINNRCTIEKIEEKLKRVESRSKKGEEKILDIGISLQNFEEKMEERGLSQKYPTQQRKHKIFFQRYIYFSTLYTYQRC